MQNVLINKASIWELDSWNASWVLLRQRIEIDWLPKLGDQLRVLTYPAGFDRLYAYRDFRALDDRGNEFVRCSSSWMLLQLETRRPLRLPPEIQDHFKNQFSPGKPPYLPLPNFKLPKVENTTVQKRFRVGAFDLDFNQHLTNTRYVEWMLECRPPSYLGTHFPTRIDLIFRQEAIYDEVLIATEAPPEHPLAYFHQLETDKNRTISNMHSTWKAYSED